MNINKYKHCIRPIVIFLTILLGVNSSSVSYSREMQNLSPQLQAGNPDFQKIFATLALLTQIEKNASLDETSSIKDVSAYVEVLKEEAEDIMITATHDEVIIDVPRDGSAIRFFNPETTPVILPFTNVQRLSTTRISDTLYKQIIQRKKPLSSSLAVSEVSKSYYALYNGEFVPRHVQRVERIARLLAAEMQLTSDFIDKLSVAVSIHDLGANGIPVHCLQSNRQLLEEIKQKPFFLEAGIEIPTKLSMDVALYGKVLKVVLENWDDLSKKERDVLFDVFQTPHTLQTIKDKGIPLTKSQELSILYHHNIRDLEKATDNEETILMASILVAADTIENGMNLFKKIWFRNNYQVERPEETLDFITDRSGIPEKHIDAITDAYKNIMHTREFQSILDDALTLGPIEKKDLKSINRMPGTGRVISEPEEFLDEGLSPAEVVVSTFIAHPSRTGIYFSLPTYTDNMGGIDYSETISSRVVDGEKVYDDGTPDTMRQDLLTLEQHVDKFRQEHPDKEVIAVSSYGNLIMDGWVAAFTDGKVIKRDDEPGRRSYFSLIVFKDGHVEFRDIWYLGNKVIDSTTGKDITETVSQAISGQPVVKYGASVNPENIREQYYNIRHLLHLPFIGDNDKTAHFGIDQLLEDREKLDKALMGEPVDLELSSHYIVGDERNPVKAPVDMEILKLALKEKGYSDELVLSPEEVTRRGQFYIYNMPDGTPMIRIAFHYAINAHHFICTDRGGNIVDKVVQGKSNRLGISLDKAGKWLRDKNRIVNGIILDNGGDSMMHQEMQPVAGSFNGRTKVASAVIYYKTKQKEPGDKKAHPKFEGYVAVPSVDIDASGVTIAYVMRNKDTGSIYPDQKEAIVWQSEKYPIENIRNIPTGSFLDNLIELIVSTLTNEESRLDSQDIATIRHIGLSSPGAHMPDGSIHAGTMPYELKELESIKLGDGVIKRLGGKWSVTANHGSVAEAISTVQKLLSHSHRNRLNLPLDKPAKIITFSPDARFNAGGIIIDKNSIMSPMSGTQYFSDVLSPSNRSDLSQFIANDTIGEKSLLKKAELLGFSSVKEMANQLLSSHGRKKDKITEIYEHIGQDIADLIITLNRGKNGNGLKTIVRSPEQLLDEFWSNVQDTERFILGGWLVKENPVVRRLIFDAIRTHLDSLGYSNIMIFPEDELPGAGNTLSSSRVLGSSVFVPVEELSIDHDQELLDTLPGIDEALSIEDFAARYLEIFYDTNSKHILNVMLTALAEKALKSNLGYEKVSGAVKEISKKYPILSEEAIQASLEYLPEEYSTVLQKLFVEAASNEADMKRVKFVILAGGESTRTWPVTPKILRTDLIPKDPGTGEKRSSLQETIHRLTKNGFISPEQIYIVTGKDIEGKVVEQVSEMGVLGEHIITEPSPAGTALALAYAAKVLEKDDPDSTMFVVHADNYIPNIDAFQETARKTVETAQAGPHFVSIGIRPTIPSTQLGYIEVGAKTFKDGAYRIQKFIEKPDGRTALGFFRETEKYLWEGGMQAWDLKTFLKALEVLPEEYRIALFRIEEILKGTRSAEELPGIYDSIASRKAKGLKTETSFLIFEPVATGNIPGIHFTVTPFDDEWSDIGTLWHGLRDIAGQSFDDKGNLILPPDSTNVDITNVENSNILPSDDGERDIIAKNIDKAIIADNPVSTLVATKRNIDKAREVIEALKKLGLALYIHGDAPAEHSAAHTFFAKNTVSYSENGLLVVNGLSNSVNIRTKDKAIVTSGDKADIKEKKALVEKLLIKAMEDPSSSLDVLIDENDNITYAVSKNKSHRIHLTIEKTNSRFELVDSKKDDLVIAYDNGHVMQSSQITALASILEAKDTKLEIPGFALFEELLNKSRQTIEMTRPEKMSGMNQHRIDYIESAYTKTMLKQILGEGNPDVVLRVPVEVLDTMPRETTASFLNAFQDHPNAYVELFISSGVSPVGKNLYRKYGIRKKAIPSGKGFKMSRLNTVTLIPALKGDDTLSAVDIRMNLGNIDMALTDSILSPVGFYNDAFGVIRSTILGLRLMSAAREIDKNNTLATDQDFRDRLQVEILETFQDLCDDPLYSKDLNGLRPEDLIELVSGANVNAITKTLNKLIKLLPITPLDIREIRNIYETAQKVLMAA